MQADRETLYGVMKVELVAAPQYFIGLPIIIAVEWNNDTTDTTLMRVPDLDLLFSQGGRINVSLAPRGGDGRPLDTGGGRGEEVEQGRTIEPHTRRRMVCDLTNMGVVFHPGHYDLTLTLLRPSVYRSNTVPNHLRELDDSDRREADSLRHLGGEPGLDTGAWKYFLQQELGPVNVAPTLGAAAREQLALLLFLHHAITTPGKLAHVDPSPLRRIHGPHLDPEVAALKYELLHTRKDPHAAAARTDMLARFPGLLHRAHAVDAGDGQLARYRSYFGPERPRYNDVPGGPDYE